VSGFDWKKAQSIVPDLIDLSTCEIRRLPVISSSGVRPFVTPCKLRVVTEVTARQVGIRSDANTVCRLSRKFSWHAQVLQPLQPIQSEGVSKGYAAAPLSYDLVRHVHR
jgi:hypothetical protein